ncbi:uncharacterized protein EV422DRAFT_621728 [Fimicolochytrium jonesii]|uniref:uncharacterized protein n=1 Tax=Fimicolochytrium jonesii TaxID=1396493 RepID=UPI0022FEC259|nr:uncharacterized protein EV422DRAFT_621728 [Fimicolochytrium jonesii]KAI8818535.1 hypothetical protein EV422DRAFT_621728 [Fimicolochytrium jonesii]
MFNTNAKSGHRRTRTKATFAASKKTEAAPEEDTPTVRQRIAEARKTGVLDLRSLNLGKLPVAAEKLSDLLALLIGQNRLTSLPNGLSTLFPRLTYLDASANKITSIPSSISDLDDLEILDLEDNPDIPRQLPASVRALVEMGRLAVLTGSPSVTAEDVEAGAEGDDTNDDSELFESDDAGTEEKGTAWRKEYYDTDDEAEGEDGGYSDEDGSEDADNASDIADNLSDLSLESVDAPPPLAVDSLTTEFALFTHRVEALENSTIENKLKRAWRAGDAILVRYVAKRYAADAGKEVTRGVVGGKSGRSSRQVSDEDDNAEEGGKPVKPLRDRNAKRQMEYARKDKERAVKRDVQAGRRSKAGAMLDD